MFTVPRPRSPLSREDEDRWAVALVVRMGDGDASAFRELYGRYGRPVYSLARQVTGYAAFAEEVVQEVFLAVWRQPELFQTGKGEFASWLLAAARHKAIDVVRREELVRRRTSALRAAAVPDADHNTTEDAAELRMRGQQVRRAVGALPAAQRQVVVLAYYGGCTQPEIASLTGTPLGTVKSRTHRAIRNLRRLLGDGEDLTGLGDRIRRDVPESEPR